MLNIKDQIFVLEIPKNGSRSLVAAVRGRYGKNMIKVEGYHTIEECVELAKFLVAPLQRPVEPYTFAAVIRDPVDRFISQIRQAERMKSQITLDEIMDKAWAQSDIVFKPQWQFLEVPTDGDKPQYAVDLRMWDMKRIQQAMCFVAQTEWVNHHVNASPRNGNIGVDQILDHKMFLELMESDHHYKPDFSLWIRAQRTNEDGE